MELQYIGFFMDWMFRIPMAIVCRLVTVLQAEVSY
jgi:hypothetical protein